MKKTDLANKAAHGKGTLPASMADEMDSAVNVLLRNLRSGQTVHLPGLGSIHPGKKWIFRPEKLR